MNEFVVQNRTAFEKKIDALVADGPANLHIVSDFDRTLTVPSLDGKHYSTYSLIRLYSILGDAYNAYSSALGDKYRGFEKDPTINEDERFRLMTEWFTGIHEGVLKFGFKRHMLDDMIAREMVALRANADTLINMSHKYDIPLLVYSGGFGNLIELFFEKMFGHARSVHIISNKFEFDESGNAVSYRKPIIHTSSKNYRHTQNHPYWKHAKTRKNVLLLGDAPTDVLMIEGIEHTTVVKIGFADDTKALDHYLRVFDAVLLVDQPLDKVNDIVKRIVKE